MDDDFETVINVVLGPVDQTINITLHKTLATLQHLTAEDRFDSRPSARRSRYRSDELHKGCPRTDGQAYRPEHRPAHAEDLPPGVQPNSEYAGEDSAERPRREAYSLPDNEPPNKDLPTTSRQECTAYCTTIYKNYKGWKVCRDKYPDVDGGPIRTYRPETSQRRGSSPPQRRNQRSLRCSNIQLPVTPGERPQVVRRNIQGAQSNRRGLRQGRHIYIPCHSKRNANQSSGGSGAKAVNSLNSTGTKKGLGSGSGPAAGIKCKNCDDNH